MKKALNSVLIIFVAVISLSLNSCNSESFTKPTKYEKVTETNDVEVSIKEGSLTSKELTLLIKNNTDNDISYDKIFVLEKQREDNWYSQNKDRYFIAIGCILKNGETNEERIEFGENLKRGNYRIIKRIGTFDTQMRFTIE